MIENIFVLIGTFVGAGFASGKEIFVFFSIYNLYGIFSIIIFSLLLFILIFKCLNIKTSLKLNSYYEFINYLENKIFFINHKLFIFIINIFLACSFYIMISAISTLFSYQFNITKFITIFISILICFFIFYNKNIKFIYAINIILMPLLILFIISLCIFNVNLLNINFNTNNNLFMAIFMGLLYFSYNSLLLIPIIFDLKINYNKKDNFKISFFYSLIIFIIMFLLNLLLLSFYNFIYDMELPILYISNTSISIFSFLYFFIVLSAIFTTMISSGYSFINNLNKNNYNKKLIVFLIFSFLFCIFSFSDLINFFYPLFRINWIYSNIFNIS